MRAKLPRLTLFMGCLLAAACGTDDQSKVSDLPTDATGVQGDQDEPPLTGGGDSSGNGGGTGNAGDAAGRPPVRGETPGEGPAAKPEVIANPFVDTAQDPFSTFGADVDTASYDSFRQSLMYGALPDRKVVRVEDFVNYFDYNDPAPAADASEPFAISLSAAPHPMGRSTTLLRVGIKAKPAPAEHKPANIVFLVDVSGSMAAPDKLPLVKVVLEQSLGVLDPTDTVSIVSYAADTRVRLAPTMVSNKKPIVTEIGKLESGGGTNGASGIELAYEQASSGFIKGGINHVILCTDGDFNLGQTSDEALVKLIQDKRQTGITLTALGFGHDNLNDSMMEKVSNAGNGTFSVVYNQDQAIEYANERMLSTLVHVAKDMKIQVELNAEKVRAYRLIGYEDRAIADVDFRDDTVDGGEVGAGHRVVALYELVLAGDDIPTPKGAPELLTAVQNDLPREIQASELVRVKVRYKEVTATDADPAAEVVRALLPEQVAASADAAGEDFGWTSAVATLAEILRESPYAKRQELATVATLINAQKTRDSDRSELASLLEKVASLLDQKKPGN